MSCGGNRGGEDDSTGPGLTQSGTNSASATDATSDAVTGNEVFDVGDSGPSGTGSADDGGDMGCQKVDFLFVIDSSNSMGTNQANLIASFPEFVATIQATLADVDSYHVGVVTSDAYVPNPAGCQIAGALVTQTGGKESSMAVCDPFAEGFRFMTDADDLGTKFACAAQVGTAGANDEAMMLGATRAIAQDMNLPGACNDSFIRSDALLVLVLITDEDDPGTCVLGGDCTGSPGDPAMRYQQVVDVKGVASNVVTLSLTRGAPGNICGAAQGTEKDGLRVMEFTQLFGMNGLQGDICAATFGPFFEDAVALIDSACSDFVPPS